MAENLKVTRYRNGDAIPHVTDADTWNNLIDEGAYCSYENDPTNAETYGYLYNWYSVIDARGLAPAGWHIPSDAEWQTLVDYLGGGNSVAGGMLKETVHWNSPTANLSVVKLYTGAPNESDFSTLLGGYRYYNGYFATIGSIADFWSSPELNHSSAWNRHLDTYYSGVYRHHTYEQNGFSVRCVRD